MAHATPSAADVANTLSTLQLSANSPHELQAKPKSGPVADSWDAELSGSDTETETDPSTQRPSFRSRSSTKDKPTTPLSPLSPISTTTSSNNLPNPPPPTPASPTPFEFPDNVPFPRAASVGSPDREAARRGSGAASPQRRPEKTTAVAGRLIAGALGVRAPRRTDEEREFDKAVREKERRRRDEERNREKREKEAAEERKRSVWED
ncbi:hypothetical protein BDV95DRAFT_617567 [Massariosphaeria phaeospora]|uniref:Uncharacterized protein n=1 Tax=Massariosphaeria phaeospora TaxID=100035 RepID=A0A7C8MCX4_9PLEO|nr:hypothetical protein BDV95DRAFT_617567 [Massariosphaeria phaeospora]